MVQCTFMNVYPSINFFKYSHSVHCGSIMEMRINMLMKVHILPINYLSLLDKMLHTFVNLHQKSESQVETKSQIFYIATLQFYFICRHYASIREHQLL